MLLHTFLLLAILRLSAYAEDKAEVNIKVSGACSPIYLKRRGIELNKYQPSIRFNPEKIQLIPKNPVIPGCVKIKAEGVEILKPVRNLLAEVEMRIGGTPDPNNPTLPCTKKIDDKVNQCPCTKTEGSCMFCDFCRQMKSQSSRISIGDVNAKPQGETLEESCKCEADVCKAVWEKERSAYVKFKNKTSTRTSYTFTSEMSWYEPKVTNVVIKLPQKTQEPSTNNEDSEVEDDEVPVQAISNEVLVKAAKAVLSSELIGADADFFANLCVEATQLVKSTDANQKVTHPISVIELLKSSGKLTRESRLDVESKTLTLCGDNDNFLNELEEQTKYAIWIIKRCLEAGKLKPEDELTEEVQKSLIDVRYHPGGTYAIVDWSLLKKLLKNVVDGEDSSILSKAVVKFGMVYALSFEARWSHYKREAKFNRRKSAFMGTPRYRMISIRQWTSDMTLATGILNNGHAAFVDESALHALDIEKNELFASKAGITSIQQFNLSAVEMAKDEQLRSEIKALLFDALLSKEPIGDQVSCLRCSARFSAERSLVGHLASGSCPKTRDPYAKYKEVESKQLKRHFPTDRTFDDEEPPLKKAHEQLELEIQKGTRDYGPKQTVTTKQALDQLTKVVQSHGAEAIDRSDVESTSSLLGRNGEKGDNLSDLSTSVLLNELKKRLNIQ